VIALARKYRPRTFASVAVQSHVANTLKGAIARGRVAHGYLLCGPRGVGKTTLARVLAMALNCERRGTTSDSGEPCGECESCRRIWAGSTSLDVVEIDAASNRGVDDARELRERALYAPSGDDRYKVYIVDEAHMLTREAWNALLKILEEPPPRVVFVFATTEPQKIAQSAAPVLSRLQRFDFKRIGPADVRDRLATVLADEGITADAEALAIIARAADGSMRDALSLTDQALAAGDGALTVERVREALGLVPEDEYLAILDLIAGSRAGDIFTAVGRLAERGVDMGAFMNGVADMIRAQLAVTLGASVVEVSERARAALEERRGQIPAADLLRMLVAIGELEQRFRKSSQQQLLLETLLVRFALLDRAVSLEEVLKSLGGEGGRGAGVPDPEPRKPTRPADSPLPMSPPQTLADSGTRAPAPTRAAPPPPPPAAAPKPAPSPTPTVPSPQQLAEHWDEVIRRVRESKRVALSMMLARAMPVASAPNGVVTIEIDNDDTAWQAMESGRDDVLAAIREVYPAVSRLVYTRGAKPANAAPTQRLTEQSVRDDRVASLRKRDPVLGAAIDTLDLELLD
jgi:DNA polymerase III subunit gamma/tau